MSAAAFLVLGSEPKHHREACLEFTTAVQHAADHHGVYIALLREDLVLDMLRAADLQGYERGRRDEHEAELRAHPVAA